MKLWMMLLVVLTVCGGAFSQWQLVWNDEFDYTGLPNPAKWGYDVGTGGNGWGNQELEYYTRDSLKNARVENGTLIITAVKEKIGQSNYSSARLITKKKGDWCYGRFEIAAKVPKGVGLWPAIWMLPTDGEYGGWPKSGELDIMENVGFDSMKVHFNIHTEAYNHSIGTNKGATITLDDPHSVFNVYAMEWYEDSVVFFANNKKTFSFKNERTGYKTWPFDKRFHLLLNVAVGGTWGGSAGVDTTVFPASMVVDYVRVYEKADVVVKSIGSSVPVKRLPAVVYHTNMLSASGKGMHSVTLYSARGVKVFAGEVNPALENNVLSCALSAGVYVAAVESNRGRYYQQVVVHRSFP